jgi:hypothetical protein
MQLILVSPILPGRTEACRRFAQEMCDGQGDAYAASRTALGIDEERIWIHETATAATVIILLETAWPDDVLRALVTSQHSFDCWFRQELRNVSGLDLAEASHKLMPELVSGWREEQSSKPTCLANRTLHTQEETDHVHSNRSAHLSTNSFI